MNDESLNVEWTRNTPPLASYYSGRNDSTLLMKSTHAASVFVYSPLMPVIKHCLHCHIYKKTSFDRTTKLYFRPSQPECTCIATPDYSAIM